MTFSKGRPAQQPDAELPAPDFFKLLAKGPLGSAYSFLLAAVILVNIASFMLSTEPSMTQHQPLCGPYYRRLCGALCRTLQRLDRFDALRFDKIETVTVCIFTVEYVGATLEAQT